MPPKRYAEKLSGEDIVALCFPITSDPEGYNLDAVAQPYVVGLHNGEVYRNRRGKLSPVFRFPANEEAHFYVRLYHHNKSKAMAIHRLVWMVGTGSCIPEGWEVHHRNKNTQDNWFTNLFCLHPVDHRKLHAGDLIEDPTPF